MADKMTLQEARDWLVEVRRRNAVGASLDDLDDHDAEAVIQAIDAHIARMGEPVAEVCSTFELRWAELSGRMERRAIDAESRLAAADALLGECDDFMENLSIDMRKFGELLSLREKVQAHLQGDDNETCKD